MIDLAKSKRVLAFFAHPDDETLACGATISKLRRIGIDVHVAIPATGIFARRNAEGQIAGNEALAKLQKDCERAMKVLGVSANKIYFGEFSDNELDKHTLLELIQWLEKIIYKVKPDVLFTHHRYCTNIDHQYCHEAAVVATRPSDSSHIVLLSAEVPSSTGYLKPVQWEPNLFVDITEQDLENKIRAMQSYAGEARPDPHPRSPEVLRALAKVRGSDAGFFFAESFMLQRGYA